MSIDKFNKSAFQHNSAETLTPLNFDERQIETNDLIPAPYFLHESGLYQEEDNNGPNKLPPTQITSSPVYISACARNLDSEEWNIVLVYQNPDGVPFVHLFPVAELSSPSSLVSTKIGRNGVAILAQKPFLKYVLAAYQQPHLPRILLTSRLGFSNARTESEALIPCYVLPERTLYPSGARIKEPVFLHNPMDLDLYRAYTSCGTLKQWKKFVAKARRNHLLKFSLFAAFGAILLRFAEDVENGGFHFYGLSSSGKSISLQFGSTPMGNGSAPNVSSEIPSLVNSWSATDNALEMIFSINSDMLLAVDELGMRSSRTVSIYGLFSGQVKDRMTASGGLQMRRKSRILLLSSGEVSVQEQIEADGRRRSKMGEIIRLIDIPIDHLSLPIDGALAESIKRECGQYYGTAGPAFVQCILDNMEDEETLKKNLRDWTQYSRKQLVEQLESRGRTNLQGHHHRLLLRFAHVLACAEIAVKYEILPFTYDEVFDAVYAVVEAALDGQTYASEAERAIEVVRAYYERYQGQMITTDRASRPNQTFGTLHDGRMLLNEEQFKMACGGLGTQLVAKALKDAGILHSNDGQHKAKVSIKALNIKATRYYILLIDRLMSDGHANEDAAEEDDAEDDAEDLDPDL